jgi:predicted Zn-dependent protease
MPRVEAAARRLAPEGRGRIERVLVAAHDQVGAWSWPDGTAVLTRRLVEELTDDEITAVLAHEAGHLALDGTPEPVSLAGGSRSTAAEEAADRAGAAILATRGLDAAAMPRMLRRVAQMAGRDSAAGRIALRRAAILETDAWSGRAVQARGTMLRCPQ